MSVPVLPFCCQTTSSPLANAWNCKSMKSPAAAPAISPPIWLTEVSSCSVAPAPASLNVTLPETAPSAPSSSVPAVIVAPPPLVSVADRIVVPVPSC